jgi:meso-butanediol dehydrogenase/(S,S)-butanediol dehydrogenase/diacetyl reductase
MSARLKGKRVLITGTSRDQGAAAQRLFVQEGARVSGCASTPGSAEAEAAKIQPAGAAIAQTVDLADADAAQRWVDWSAEQMGGIDVVYNNAAAAAFAGVGEMRPDAWKFSIEHELTIAFHTTRAAWRHLIAAGGGVIVTTASVAGLVAIGRLGNAAHAAAKAGLIGFTRQLAAEGAPHGIRAVAISPGFVAKKSSKISDDLRQYMNNLQMIKRPVQPEEVAYLALYLCSDEAAMVTGANFVIDGGWSAWAG